MRLANIIVLLVSLWLQITTCGDGECKTCGYNHKLYPVSKLSCNSYNLLRKTTNLYIVLEVLRSLIRRAADARINDAVITSIQS